MAKTLDERIFFQVLERPTLEMEQVKKKLKTMKVPDAKWMPSRPTEKDFIAKMKSLINENDLDVLIVLTEEGSMAISFVHKGLVKDLMSLLGSMASKVGKEASLSKLCSVFRRVSVGMTNREFITNEEVFDCLNSIYNLLKTNNLELIREAYLAINEIMNDRLDLRSHMRMNSIILQHINEMVNGLKLLVRSGTTFDMTLVILLSTKYTPIFEGGVMGSPTIPTWAHDLKEEGLIPKLIPFLSCKEMEVQAKAFSLAGEMERKDFFGDFEPKLLELCKWHSLQNASIPAVRIISLSTIQTIVTSSLDRADFELAKSAIPAILPFIYVPDGSLPFLPSIGIERFIREVEGGLEFCLKHKKDLGESAISSFIFFLSPRGKGLIPPHEVGMSEAILRSLLNIVNAVSLRGNHVKVSVEQFAAVARCLNTSELQGKEWKLFALCLRNVAVNSTVKSILNKEVIPQVNKAKVDGKLVFCIKELIDKIISDDPKELEGRNQVYDDWIGVKCSQEKEVETSFSRLNTNDEGNQKTCEGCGKDATKKCSVCKKIWYCGRECQVAHWPSHKKSCAKSG
eukprot:TRINITY_DN4068_c0_g1_i1.p1 TRINITY_DN4068_c0_g1~~TRINITY_DN4068_c0_g1_i1.p1  ORF type:complete len:569 (-),score=203.37 TRINITY_DN4068_c0_g1_i1:52-1758(-)